MNDRFELVEVIGSGDDWRLQTIATFGSLDLAAQMLIEASTDYPDKHFTLYEIYD